MGDEQNTAPESGPGLAPESAPEQPKQQTKQRGLSALFSKLDARLAGYKYGLVLGKLIRLVVVGGVIVALVFGKQALIDGMDNTFFTDYHLTSAQIKEGYDRTRSNSRGHEQQDVAFRYFHKSEYLNDSRCASKADFCLKVIPLAKHCHQIRLTFDGMDGAGAMAPTVEQRVVYLTSADANGFKLGAVQVMSVRLHSSKSTYGAVDQLYCTNFGG